MHAEALQRKCSVTCTCWLDQMCFEYAIGSSFAQKNSIFAFKTNVKIKLWRGAKGSCLSRSSINRAGRCMMQCIKDRVAVNLTNCFWLTPTPMLMNISYACTCAVCYWKCLNFGSSFVHLQSGWLLTTDKVTLVWDLSSGGDENSFWADTGSASQLLTRSWVMTEGGGHLHA